MPVMPLPMMLTAVMALAPLGSGQEARLAAWLNWAAAYRDCYEPAAFSLHIDEEFTARCIERILRQQEGGPPAQRAATDALIAETPQLVTMLNAPAHKAGHGQAGYRTAPRLDPASPPRPPLIGPGNGSADRSQSMGRAQPGGS
jgi:hypothetical protein